MEHDLEHLQQLVSRHAPVFYLHPADRFMPCSVEFFMEHSKLVQQSGAPGQGPQVLLSLGAVTPHALLEQQALHPPPAKLWLDLEPTARAGFPLDTIDDVPLYAHVKEVITPPDSSGHSVVEALEINYLTFYAYNGPYNVGGMRLIQTGAHDGDWEHITARVHPSTGDLLGMWYNAHRSRDGMWVAGGRVRRTQEGRPIAYTAQHGHGVYPMSGRIPRHFFLGNDLCSGRGPVWRPHTVILLPPVHDQDLEGDAGHAAHSPLPPHSPTVRLDQALTSATAAQLGDTPGEEPAASAGSSQAAGSTTVACSSTTVACVQWHGGTVAGLEHSVGSDGRSRENTSQHLSALHAELQALDLTDGAHPMPAGEQQSLQGGAVCNRPQAAPGDAPLREAPSGERRRPSVPGCSPVSPRRGSSGTADPKPSSLVVEGGGATSLVRRRLQRAHSRGSSLGREDSFGSTSSTVIAAGRTAAPSIRVLADTGVCVVVDDPCLWLWFRGQWGQTDAPICQGWFHTAEPPQSRTTLLRLFGHFWPETQRV